MPVPLVSTMELPGEKKLWQGCSEGPGTSASDSYGVAGRLRGDGKAGKGVHRGYILSPCLLNLYAEYIMQNARLDEAQAGIQIAGRNGNNLRYADDTSLIAENEEEPKNILMKVKEESEKADLKLNVQKTKIMAFGPITSRQTDAETMETVTDFISLGYKIAVDGDCSHEIKRRLLLGRKAMTSLDSILKSRDITLLTNSV